MANSDVVGGADTFLELLLLPLAGIGMLLLRLSSIVMFWFEGSGLGMLCG